MSKFLVKRKAHRDVPQTLPRPAAEAVVITGASNTRGRGRSRDDPQAGPPDPTVVVVTSGNPSTTSKMVALHLRRSCRRRAGAPADAVIELDAMSRSARSGSRR